MRRILVTGAAGPASSNFIRAIKHAPEKFYVVGTDANETLMGLTLADVIYKVPKARESGYVEKLREIAEREKVEFVHPQTDAEVLVLSKHVEEIGFPTLLPKPEVVEILSDKYLTYEFFRKKGIPVPETRKYSKEAVLELADKYGWPVWIRARRGAGARLSLPVNSVEEAEHWVKLWTLKGVPEDEFIVQEYIPGKDAAWDSFWYEGELVFSFSRERLQYIYPHLSPSGLTGTPAAARVFVDDKLNRLGLDAVKALDAKASGFYCIDVKYKDGKPYITEINPRPHTTFSLWCYSAVKALGLGQNYNIPYVYFKLGVGEGDGIEFPGMDALLEGLTMLRHIDAGCVLVLPDGKKVRVL